MKKHLLSLFALASMAFASSCTSEEIVSQSTGNEVKVTFTTELRYDVKSRAVGDDTECIDELVFAVYDENQELLPSLTQKVSDGKITLSAVKEDGTREATINVILVKGQTYSFAFWAQDKDYTAYSFDEETATVSVSYGQTANNKNADAFFAKINDYTVTGSFEQNVTLKRPFAQVNFLTTNYDITNAKAAGFEPDQSSIVVQNAATSLNVLTGKVSGDMEAEFKLADWIKDETTKILDGNNAEIIFGGSQNATTFKYLATAYFLPTSDVEDVEITASMSAIQSDKSSKAPVELTAPNVKAKRNYRTNIYGNLLTSNGTFYVTVDPGFDGDHSKELEDPTTVVVGTIAEANALFEKGETNVTIQVAPASAETINLPSTSENVTVNFNFEDGVTPAAITIGYADDATDGEKPSNIEVNGDAGYLIINAPNSTVTLNGSYTSVDATTADNTLIVPKGVTIGTLTLKKGNAKIYYGAVTILTKVKGYSGTITWLVDSKEQLAQISTDVKEGKMTFSKEIVELTNDIDLNNEEWTPIGTTNAFKGAFDGANHSISNLTVNVTDDRASAGLFGNVEGNIKNVKLYNVNISGHYKAGAIVGSIYGNIDNCHVDGGSILSTPGSTNDNANNVGGIVGYLSENSKTGYIVSNCSVKNLNITAYRSVGGVAGRLMTGATVENCTVENTVVTADMLCKYADSKYNNPESAKAGEIVGDNRFDSDLSLNTYNNVTVNVNRIVDGVASVSNNTQLAYVLSVADVNTVNLGTGKYVASLYPGDIPSRTSLTIVGTEGTQFAYTGTNYGGQLGIDRFDSFTIKNCEILKRENVKNWGMVVFGSSNNEKGIYTFENCTFKGVGTQGIYINEKTSGATYNIQNCTFEGDFGSEGVISIQNNDDVKHIVNVLGCTFNTTSKKIHVHYAYNGWTLNTDLKASTATDIATLAKMGLTTINLAEGEYIIPTDLKGKTLTLKGDKNVVIDATYNYDQSLVGANITFEGVTIKGTNNKDSYNGIAYAELSFVNCDVNDMITLYNTASFEDCTFTCTDAYAIKSWGAYDVTVKKCVFNAKDRAFLLYPGPNANDDKTVTAKIESCTFNATDSGSKAAIEVADDYKWATFNLTINSTTVNGYNTTTEAATTYGGTSLGTNVWGNKNLLPAGRLNVVIDGTEVY